jgi:hypothetical protein
LALRPLRRIFWAAGGENPPPRFSWSTVSTRMVVLVEQGAVVLALLALHPALAGVVIEGSVALAAPRLAAKVGASVLPKPYLCPTAAVVPPLTPPLLVSDERTHTFSAPPSFCV